MSISFLPNGNLQLLTANTTSGSTLTTVRAGGASQIGAWMIDNLSANAVIVNVGFANTVVATASQGFAIPANGTKYLNLHQATNVNYVGANGVVQNTQATTAYLAANAVTGTAQVAFTPVYIYR